jgi:hypothetical protein
LNTSSKIIINLSLILGLITLSCDTKVIELTKHSQKNSQIWTKQLELDLGNRIEMVSDSFGLAISRGKGTDIKGKVYFYENGYWNSVFEFPYSDYPFIKKINNDNVLFLIHETHTGNYRPRMFLINRYTRKKTEIPLPKIMWDKKDFSMWKSVSFNENGVGWMVGQLGNILYYDGKKWNQVKSPVDAKKYSNVLSYDLNDVYVGKNGNGWAVGRSGIILRLENNIWKEFNSPTKNELNKVDVIDDSTAWIVGEKGTVLKFANKKWRTINIGLKTNLLSVKIADKKNVWVCGENTTLVKYNGKSWSIVDGIKIFNDTFNDLSIIKTIRNDFLIYIIGNDGIYSNNHKSEISFSNITSETALQRNGISATFFDANNDGFADLLINSENGPNLFYQNENGSRFIEVPLNIDKNYEQAQIFHSADFNNDSNIDLILMNKGRMFSGYFGNGNYDFINFPDKKNNKVIMPKVNAALNSIQSADFDNDGNLDLYVFNYNENDFLLKGDGAGNFIDVMSNSGINKSLNHESAGIVLSDFNNDNLTDIFLFYRIPADGKLGELYLNKGNFYFSNKNEKQFLTNENPNVFSAIANDFNNDTNTDLLLFINEDHIHLYLNDGKANFIDHSKEAGFSGSVLHPEPSNGVIASADVNNDGYVDLFAGSDLYFNSPTTFFTKSNSSTGLNFTGNPVFSDYDNDGDMDIFVGSSRNALGSGDRSALFRNNLNNNNFLKIKLIGSSSNKYAVGTKVFLFGYSEDGKLIYKTQRQNSLGGNPLNQNDPSSIHFGLNPKLQYKLKIIFPSGIIREITSIKHGSFLQIYEQTLIARTISDFIKSINRTVAIINPVVELVKLLILILLMIAGFTVSIIKKHLSNKIKLYTVFIFVFIYIILFHKTIFYGQLFSSVISYGVTVALFFLFCFIYTAFKEKTESKYISHYKLLDVIGIGGMGKVLRTIDTNTKNIVALKIINPTLLKDEENQKRLSAEGEMLSSFNHPNIIKVYEVAKTPEHVFIAMEYLSGGTLEDFISKNHPIRIDEAKKILLQICDGLIAIHEKKIIHRDLKSTNIMFDSEMKVRIMDFGLSKSPLVTTMTSLGTVLGTLGFVAPEQVTNINVDHRTDIFSFGVIMYQLFTNQLPFKGENEIALIHSIFNTTPVNPKEYNPEISDELLKIIFCCLEKNPANRYNSVVEIKEKLNKL